MLESSQKDDLHIFCADSRTMIIPSHTRSYLYRCMNDTAEHVSSVSTQRAKRMGMVTIRSRLCQTERVPFVSIEAIVFPADSDRGRERESAVREGTSLHHLSQPKQSFIAAASTVPPLRLSLHILHLNRK